MKPKNDNPWKVLGWTGLIGAEVAVLIVAGYFLGSYLQRVTGYSGWVLIGVISGLAVGVFSIVMMIRRYLGEDNE